MRQDPGPEILSAEVPVARKGHCQVMDIYPNHNDGSFSLESRCYMSTPEDATLVPEGSTQYTCRWIHLTHRSPQFDKFVETVDNMMRNYNDDDRRRVRDGLRSYQVQNETKGFYGSSFRSGIAPLDPRNETDDVFDFVESRTSDPTLDGPVFASFPTLHFWPPPSTATNNPSSHDGDLDPKGHRPKSLLQYHYRFGKDIGERSVNNGSLTSPVESNIPVVAETWCLVVDKKNIITVSGFIGGTIWPQGHRHKHDWVVFPFSFRMACQEYFSHQPEFLESVRILEGWAWWRFRTWKLYTLLVGVLNMTFGLIPGAGLVGYMFSSLLYWASGIHFDFLGSTRMSTVVSLLDVSDFGQIRDHAFQKSASRVLRALGSEVQDARSLELMQMFRATSRLIFDDWLDAEDLMRTQEQPTEELYKAVRKLWTIYIHFSMNFLVDHQGKVYAFHQDGAMKRLTRILVGWFKRFWYDTNPAPDGALRPNDAPVTFQPSRPGETLQDLEDKFVSALANLERLLSLTAAEVGHVKEQENKQMLQLIERSINHPAIACLFRMCTLTTPTRNLITARDISDMYARAIAQQEWLARESVTQALIYQISAIKDELNIIKITLRRQQDILSQISSALAKSLTRSNVDLRASAPPEDPHSDPNLLTNNNDDKRQKILTNALRRKYRVKYDILMTEIEQHEDAVKRLESKATGLINIKAEGQGVAIFVFTVVTIVFLPLSFVTSFFGMNTTDIRDIEQGQWIFWAIGGPLTVTVLLVAWLVARRGPKWHDARQKRRLRDVHDWWWGYRD